MFKSASTTQFQNTSYTQSSYSGLSSVLNDLKNPAQTRTKKLGVKFEIENDKENAKGQIDISQISTFGRREKHTKTWTHQRIPTQNEPVTSQKALKQMADGLNFDKSSSTNWKEKFLSGSKMYQTDATGFGLKKQLGSKKLIEQQQPKFERSYKQCKSMKTLPSYSPEEDSDFISTIKVKKQRKFQKFEAYNDLLKQSESLVQKYKKLEQEKVKLRNDLKNQIDSHSKSSKKITFLEETESSKNYNSKIQPPSFSSSYDVGIKSPKSNIKDYTLNTPKYGNYDLYESCKLDSAYSPKMTKTSFKTMNKTFSSKPTSSIEESSVSSYTLPKTEYSTYSGSFGLSKSASSKKLPGFGLERLSLDDFELGKCLGSGAFGEVFPAKHKKTGWLFAMKKVKKQTVKYMLDQFIQQIKIQLYLDHPNIVKLYSFFDDTLHFYIIMQYMQGGSLFSQLKKQKTLSLQQTSTKLRQVCQGLQYMHQHSILHRDIKPQNIVLSHNVSKLCDFGWSAICKDRRTTYCGTLDYVSPEIIEGDGYDDSVDVWCVGVLAYELIVGKTPFYNISRKQTMKKIMDCNLEYPANMPDVVVGFVKKILRKNPEQRQTIEQILKDPLLKISQTSTPLF